MIQQQLCIIRDFYESNSNPQIIKKIEKFFKDGYDGYGIETKLAEKQVNKWIKEWGGSLSMADCLQLGDALMRQGRYDEKNLAIAFLRSKRTDFSKETFRRLNYWFEVGINNWATTDVLCWYIISIMLADKVIDFNDLKPWNDAVSPWQRRSVPVALYELLKIEKELNPDAVFQLVEPLMLDGNEYVQKGLGTLFREMWKYDPSEIEAFLLKWKDVCGRLIIQYATEKMTPENRSKFKKSKGV